jgi:D-alanyl-D-alanine carboxypeptidase (penicillin-binding protein 5/6)
MFKKKGYSTPKFGAGVEWIIAAVILILLITLAYQAMLRADAKQAAQMDTVFRQARIQLEEEGKDVKTVVDIQVPLHSQEIILLQLPERRMDLERKSAWVDTTTGEGIGASDMNGMINRSWLHNRIRFRQNADERMYPASMTKILTALVAIENIPDLDRTVTITKEDLYDYYSTGAAIAGFGSEEHVRAGDLLYGLMLKSGSECASALAIEAAGSTENFIDLMNNKAAEIGMKNSHFTNTVGLYDDENYSTVSDIAFLVDYAIRNDTFYRIFTAQSYTTDPTNIHREGLEMESSLSELQGKDPSSKNEILGGKTGYTDESGQNLASIFTIDGMRFILVTASAHPENYRNQSYHFDDLVTVFDSVQVYRDNTE